MLYQHNGSKELICKHVANAFSAKGFPIPKEALKWIKNTNTHKALLPQQETGGVTRDVFPNIADIRLEKCLDTSLPEKFFQS